ncbi:Aldo/keto reductase [Seinonella peptonophila]|uniref:Aldo/keto reductase n=1 Tax=Seinonella peptonophila TaxID=112248 RepID=A0A1M4XAC6_9BACL|nr:aldo/keto reductase [Seinonella peptonophila]SHE90437.1 Aldo/keto reductase [Seinonella peptonophila]
MSKELTSSTTLHNGVKMPWLGLGVWKSREGGEVEKAVESALKLGYRSIDTARIYENESGVSRGIEASGVARKDIFLTTKVWNTDLGYEETLRAFEDSKKRLQTDYLDLYLIHWPVENKFVDAWKALEKLYETGEVRAIGVCNFHIHHLKTLENHANLAPMVNQVEFHPYLTQTELRAYCEQHQIQFEAWSPLMQGNFLKDETILSIADKYQRTPAQILLRWDLQHNVVTIPKSVREDRIKENTQIFDFELTQADIDILDQLNRDQRFGADPDNFNF